MNSRLYALITCTLLTLISHSAQAASFDCNKATRAVEKMVCASPKLSTLDEQLDKAYVKSMTAPGADKVRLRTAQREWIKLRDRCKDEACITASYRSILAVHNVSDDSLPITPALLKELQGVYTRASDCWIFDPKGNPQKCGDGIKDTFEFSAATDKSVNVEMLSVQSNAHMCEMHGPAFIVGQNLVYKETNPPIEVQIVITNHSISFKGANLSGLCGMRASLAHIVWERDTKRPNKVSNKK